jgi:hypothetical protein
MDASYLQFGTLDRLFIGGVSMKSVSGERVDSVNLATGSNYAARACSMPSFPTRK